jgi:hypothetical protein
VQSGIVLYAFLITLYGERVTINTNYATAAAACQSAIVLQVQLRTAQQQADPNATVTVLNLNGAPPCRIGPGGAHRRGTETGG